MPQFQGFCVSSLLFAIACGSPSATPAKSAAPAEAQLAQAPLPAAEPSACGMQGHSDGESAAHACGMAHDAPAEGAAPTQQAAEANPATATLTRIGDRGGVCMLSNRYLGERADVPIEVAGKTYRGCCANCAARLGSQADMRTALDPVTGHSVDKGSAILARDAQNRVFYFESEDTLAQYSAR